MAAEQKTIAQILRCSEEQAAAFARRVQDLVGAPVSPELIVAAMQKVKAKDIASPQRVAEYISQEMERRAKGITTPKRSTRAQAASAKGTTKQPTRAKAARSAQAAPEEQPSSPGERTEQLEQARQRSVMAQLDRLLEENWAWASAQKYEVPPKRWAANEFVREVRRAVFTDKSPLPKILKIARSLHADKWILTPGAVADVILKEIAEKEGE